MQNNRKSISAAKQSFLAQGNHDSHGLNAIELIQVAQHYKDKFNINLIVNGETRIGKSILEEKRKTLREKMSSELLTPFTDKSVKYANILFCDELDKEDKNLVSLFTQGIDYLSTLGIDSPDKEKLTREQLQHLNQICIDSKKTDILDKAITVKLELLAKEIEENIENCSLNGKEIQHEINSLQETLKDNEFVGYAYSSEARTKQAHFEFLIISNKQLIKLIHWHMGEAIQEESFKSMPLYFSGINRLGEILKNSTAEVKMPQGDGSACGTLGTLYIKELLKNNAEQLNEFAILFPFIKEGNIHYYFIPSPQVLRYSQSISYNEFIKNLLMSNEDHISVTFKKPGEEKKITDQITTYKKLMLDTLDYAKQNGDTILQKQCEDLLTQLPIFRQRWGDAYQEMSLQRSQMDKSVDSNKANVYLSYATRRMKAISQSIFSSVKDKSPETSIEKTLPIKINSKNR